MSLSPSQRIKLIKEIADRLASEEYPLIDVTLKQFSMDTSNEWSDTKYSYVIRMIEDASDQSLIELGQHVGFNLENETTRGVDPPFWHTGMFRLFVSHLARHRTFSGELQVALLSCGISSFIAHNDIEPTLEWQTQIETACNM